MYRGQMQLESVIKNGREDVKSEICNPMWKKWENNRKKAEKRHKYKETEKGKINKKRGKRLSSTVYFFRFAQKSLIKTFIVIILVKTGNEIFKMSFLSKIN